MNQDKITGRDIYGRERFCRGLSVICPIETCISLMQRDDPLHFILQLLIDIRPFNINYNDTAAGRIYDLRKGGSNKRPLRRGACQEGLVACLYEKS